MVVRLNCLPLAGESEQRRSLKDTLEMRGFGGGRRCRTDLSSDETLGRFQGTLPWGLGSHQFVSVGKDLFLLLLILCVYICMHIYKIYVYLKYIHFYIFLCMAL